MMWGRGVSVAQPVAAGSQWPLAAPRTCIKLLQGTTPKNELRPFRVLPPTTSAHFIMAETYLQPSSLLSVLGVVVATGLAYFIAAAYRHRSRINQLRKQGFVSLPPTLRAPHV